MPAPILATKLYLPPSRRSVVVRPRLVECLNSGLAVGHRLTLVSAPAVLSFGVGALLYGWLLFRTALVPRWLAGWGIVGAM